MALPERLQQALRSGSLEVEEGQLLGDLEGSARRDRAALLEWLAGEGLSVEELRAAVVEGRLGSLVIERLVDRPGDYTGAELSQRSGVDVEVLKGWYQAIGVSRNWENAKVFNDADVETARRLKDYLDLGVPEKDLLAIARTLGLGLARVAEGASVLVADALLGSADDDPDLALRMAAHARALAELEAPVLAHVLALQLQELMRSYLVGAAEHEGGSLGDGRTVAVCFADLVGFTQLGEEIAPGELLTVADRLAELATGVAVPPVRLVKTLGDAVMLVSPDARPLLDAALDLVATVSSLSDEMPPVRAGIAYGTALSHGGDWYGQPVNVASRVTALARAGTVVATDEVRQGLGSADYRWSELPPRPLKGIRDRHRLFRVRPPLE